MTTTVNLPEREAPKRSAKWCSRCGRKHSRFDACGLRVVIREAKSENNVIRLALPQKEEKDEQA